MPDHRHLGLNESVTWPIFQIQELPNVKLCLFALASVAQCIEHWPVNQRVSHSIRVRAHVWALGQVPSREHTRGNHTMFLSLSFPLPSPLSKNK